MGVAFMFNPQSLQTNMTLIQDINLDSGAAASFDFTSIPLYPIYKLILQLQPTTTGGDVQIKFNNDGTAVYYNNSLRIVGASMTSANANAANIGLLGGTTDNGVQNFFDVTINNRSGTVAGFTKSWLSNFVNHTNHWGVFCGDYYSVAAAISRITITDSNAGTFAQRSDARLYGLV